MTLIPLNNRSYHFYKFNLILFRAYSKNRLNETILIKVRKRTKIRNRYNPAPDLTQDTNGKVTTSRLDITSESQEVSPFPAGDHKASINRRAQTHKYKTDIHKRSTTLKQSVKMFNRFHGAPTSPLVQMWIKTKTQK